MIAVIIIGLAVLWLIERTMIDRAEHMDRMEAKENQETNFINNTYNGNVDAVNDEYNFPSEKIVDVEVIK